MHTTRILLALVATTGLFAQDKAPKDRSSVETRLRHATEAFQDVMSTPDKGIPRELFEKAECVVIVPDLIKAAFVVGGKYGRGFASCRHGEGWTAPAGMRIEGGSFGFQLGAQSTDLVMLVMNKRGMDRLLGDKFTIGGEASAAAGPVGRTAAAMTDAMLHAEILTWSRSRGLFAGVSLDGSTLRPDKDENVKLYGRDVTNRQILEGEVPVPPVARTFVETLERYSRQGERQITENRTPQPASKQLSEPGGRATLGEKQVHFATGKAAIPRDAEPALNDVAKAMKDNPNWKIRVEGYTDSVGSNASNMKLSQDRANAVANWLADHGVDRSRITTKGYGESKPVSDNSTDDGRAQNRRVEIVRTDSPKG